MLGLPKFLIPGHKPNSVHAIASERFQLPRSSAPLTSSLGYSQPCCSHLAVYKEYKDKWASPEEEAPARPPRSNRPNPLAPVHPRHRDRSPLLAPRAAASAPAVAAHLPTSTMDPSVQGGSSSSEVGSYDWPEGYGALLQVGYPTDG